MITIYECIQKPFQFISCEVTKTVFILAAYYYFLFRHRRRAELLVGGFQQAGPPLPSALWHRVSCTGYAMGDPARGKAR